MRSPYQFSLSTTNSIFMLLLIHTLLLHIFMMIPNIARAQVKTKQRIYNNSISAFLVFGDSTVDPGNNNYVAGTVAKGNFPPYGKDFVNHIATGRFTNGRLVTDFLSSYVGVKDIIPPYLDPTLSISELMTGVSFASGGSGYDPLTPSISGVISIQRQIEYFREYKSRIEHSIGKENTKNLLNEAVFVVSAGTNDYILNYFGVGSAIRQQTYPTIASYQKFLMQLLETLIQDLSNEGARKIVVASVPPMGCLPIVITLNMADASPNRKCIENMVSVARNHNTILKNKLNSMQTSHVKIHYADIYQPLSDMIQSQQKFGFDHVNIGCCGTGFIEASVLCNPKSPICNDVSKYVFWDSVHPTERAYQLIFESLRPVIGLVIKGL